MMTFAFALTFAAVSGIIPEWFKKNEKRDSLLSNKVFSESIADAIIPIFYDLKILNSYIYI